MRRRLMTVVAMAGCAVAGALVGGTVPMLGASSAPRADRAPVAVAVESASDLATTPITPQRFLDTRKGQPSLGTRQTPLGAREAFTMQVAGKGDVPEGATAVVVNVTAVNATSSSFITVYPTGASRPTASLLNPAPGRTVFNAATVLLSTGSFQIYNNAGSVDVIVDVMAYLTEDLTASVESLQAGDVLVPPSGSGAGGMFVGSNPDWASYDWHGDELAAIIDSVQPSPGRYSTMRLEAVMNVLPAKTFELCLRIASEQSGPIEESAVCVDQSDTEYYTDDSGNRYFVIEGPIVPVEDGRLYLQAKLAGEADVNFSFRAFRMFG